MAAPQQFRKFADICERMAKEPGSLEYSAELTDMARTWRGLADEAERFEQMVLEMDQSFDTREPHEIGSRVQRRSR